MASVPTRSLQLLRRKLRWRSPLRRSPIYRITTDAELRQASLAALSIPALKDGVFRAIRINVSELVFWIAMLTKRDRNRYSALSGQAVQRFPAIQVSDPTIPGLWLPSFLLTEYWRPATTLSEYDIPHSAKAQMRRQ